MIVKVLVQSDHDHAVISIFFLNWVLKELGAFGNYVAFEHSLIEHVGKNFCSNLLGICFEVDFDVFEGHFLDGSVNLEVVCWEVEQFDEDFVVFMAGVKSQQLMKVLQSFVNVDIFQWSGGQSW